ncbi:MAG: TrkH family potassium uptake protein [Spirochaetales bacterium]|jgi:trk system potassium uptake protein TrkH|nr:TrkH family potassium uptake protein [Spirochaetales bacterium]
MIKRLYVLRLTALVQMGLAGLMLFPGALAFWEGRPDLGWNLLLSACLALVRGGGFLFLTRRERRRVISSRDSFLFVTATWVLASFFGALPFWLSEYFADFASAYFEAMSGFTTTGATAAANVDGLPMSFLLWRALSHWLGGMGIVVMLVALLPLLGSGGALLVNAEASGPTVDKLTPRIADNARMLWFIYIGLTVLLIGLLWAMGLPFFEALCIGFSAISSGGFSTRSQGIDAYGSPGIEILLIVFMFLAGVNFSLFHKILKGKPGALFKDEEFRVYLFIVLAAGLLVAGDLFLNSPLAPDLPPLKRAGELWRKAGFQTVSILTSTGLSAADHELWPALSRAVIFLLMFCGGCSGSTSGGIKILRLTTMVKLAVNNIRYMIYPRGVFRLKINKTEVPKDVVYSIAGFFALYVFSVLILTLVTAAFGFDLTTSLSAALASLGNVGLGLGGIAPSGSWTLFPAPLKLILSFGMLAGRLELFTVFALFTPSFWKK